MTLPCDWVGSAVRRSPSEEEDDPPADGLRADGKDHGRANLHLKKACRQQNKL